MTMVKLYTKLENIITRDKNIASLRSNYTYVGHKDTWVHNTKLNKFLRSNPAPLVRPQISTTPRQNQTTRVVESRRLQQSVARTITPSQPRQTVLSSNLKSIVIHRYGVSEGSKALKDYLESQGVTTTFYREGQVLNNNHLLITWGKPTSSIRGTPKFELSNNIPTVNKIRTFEYLNQHNLDTVKWTTSKEEAKQWILNQPDLAIYCRTVIDGQEGAGIVVAQSADEIVNAPLYSQQFKGVEFRCFFVNGKLVHTTQKRALNEESRRERGIELNELVRNTAGGYIFSINPDPERAAKIKNYFDSHAVERFTGAIDLICNREGLVKILECNSACGLEPVEFQRGERISGTSTVKMGNAILDLYQEVFDA